MFKKSSRLIYCKSFSDQLIGSRTIKSQINKSSFNLINNHQQSSNIHQSRHLSSTSIKFDSESRKDPFFEIGLGKNKSKNRRVFAWGLSSTGAVGNTKYFTTPAQKHETILKPYHVRYFYNMKVSILRDRKF